MQDKTNADYWDKSWQETPFGNYSGIEKHLALNRKLDCLFRKFLKKGDKKILEIGCAGGKHLIFFAKEFGYDVYGIDYSEKGAALAEENMKIAGVAGKIFCQDIFKASLPEESFDIVYSMGLIEHFDNPEEIIKAHIKMLKNGGILIITVPNFKDSLILNLNKILGKADTLLSTHNQNIMDKAVLRELVSNKGINVQKLDYFGPVDISTVFYDVRSKPALFLAHLFNQAIGYATFFMPASRYFSPYLVLIGEKVEDGSGK